MNVFQKQKQLTDITVTVFYLFQPKRLICAPRCSNVVNSVLTEPFALHTANLFKRGLF